MDIMESISSLTDKYEIFENSFAYPGGKSRALTKLNPFIPDLSAYDEYREPFLGGGSVALFITKRYPHIKVWVNDLYEPLVNFPEASSDVWSRYENGSHSIKE